MISKKIFLNLSVLLIFTLITLIFFFPLLKNFSSAIIDDYDGLMITWSLNRVVQNFPSFSKIMAGNTFYPFPYSHAYSDAFITDGLVALPFVKLTGEPVAAFNVNLIISQILLLFFTYLFLSEISNDAIINILLSLAFAFSPMRLHYLTHLQMFSLYWLPISGLSLIKFSKSKKTIFLYLFFLSFLLQTLNSFLPGFFIIFLFIALYLGDSSLREAIKRNLRHFLLGLALSGLILFPVIKIYFLVSKTFNYVRPITDVIHFSLSPEEIFTKFFSPVLLILFGFSFLISFTSEVAEWTPRRWTFLGIALGGFVMALGPVLHWFGKTVKIGSLPIPLPYAFFYYLVPGFKGFRTPSRWIFIFGFGVVAFSAVVLKNFLKKKSRLSRFFLYLLLAGSLIFFTKAPQNYFKVPAKNEYPKVYQWLENQPGQVIVEMPIYYWGDLAFGKREAYRMLYSLEHQKKMVNGYSGFSPPEWEKLVIDLRSNFPDNNTLLNLKKLGVNYLVVHGEEFKDSWPPDFQKKLDFLKAGKDLKLIYEDDQDLVYAF